MNTLIHRDSSSLISDLMARMGAFVPEPDVRLEEFMEDGRYVVRADLPGIDPEKDIEVSVDRGMLRLHGERRTEKHDAHRSEIRYGSIERVLRLPEGVGPDDVEATYQRGVLTITLPAAPAGEPRKIPVAQVDPG
ncbi:MAG: Hsp20/alpha crystallin family protein [Nocardioides sp.]|nr:Hsp20/alpha crystallin family protein [Nocardioides sp.]